LPNWSEPLVTTAATKGTQPWYSFKTEFKVQSDDCNYQILRLELDAKNPVDSQISGRVLFDNLKIVGTDVNQVPEANNN
jgi:hypothetical protein